MGNLLYVSGHFTDAESEYVIEAKINVVSVVVVLFIDPIGGQYSMYTVLTLHVRKERGCRKNKYKVCRKEKITQKRKKTVNS